MFLDDEQVFLLIENKVKRHEPFALLRYGDGEGVFAFMESGESRQYKGAARKHWNEIPKTHARIKISSHIKNSYVQCDVAGIPVLDNIGFKDIFYWKFTFEHFLAYHSKPYLCDMNIHIAMYRSGFLERLVKGQQIFYVSCRDIDDYFLEHGAVRVERLAIPAQYRFEETKPTVPFYKVVDRVESEIRRKNLKGVLCFLAAGVAGKQLGIMMREQGGIVLDMGSVFDLIGGVKTRTWIKRETETDSYES